MLRLPEQYNWYYDRQKRIGGRNAVFAKLDVQGQEVGAVFEQVLEDAGVFKRNEAGQRAFLRFLGTLGMEQEEKL